VAERIWDVRKGDRLDWDGISIEVTRVARDGTWADIRCQDYPAMWTKRQPLPMPEGTVRADA
jgi:hypothetical protein